VEKEFMSEPERTRQIPNWLQWAREIQALSQTGMHYAPDDYHRQRYTRLQEIAADILASQSNIPRDQLLAAFLPFRGYATPKVDVRGAVFRNDKLLLVRERRDGGWCLPGGWADVGDLPSAMVEREVREESGILVRASKLVGVYDTNRELGEWEVLHAYKLVFLCADLGGEPTASDETSEAQFFDRREIPGNLSSTRTTLRHLDAVYAHRDDIARPTDFD
jgi:ADP-ribose pyrophosphatase YjhB (NUDIX family)